MITSFTMKCPTTSRDECSGVGYKLMIPEMGDTVR